MSLIANEKINTFCAGRTDAGVHALEQIIHFNTSAIRKNHSWIFGVNSILPTDIIVHWAKIVPDDFHARFSAISRYYRYIIYNSKTRSPILANITSHFYEYLDVVKIKHAGLLLVGENDFSSFRSSVCQSKTPWRNLIYFDIQRYNNFIFIDFHANSFLHHMVRNIVGSLIEVGKGKKNDKWLYNLLKKKNRNLAGATAPAKGLYLIKVFYPKYFKLPINTSNEFFDFYIKYKII